MGETAIRTEDMVGLGVAVVLHVLLAVALVLQMFFEPDPYVSPERVTVSLATEVSLESTAPDPIPESRAAVAPTLSDVPAPPADDAPGAAQPDASTAAPSRASTRPERRTPFPDTDRVRPDRQPERPTQAARTGSTRPAGGSQIGEDFLAGQGDSARTDDTRAPAATFGRSERAALSSAITRQLRPHWTAPQGADAELLESVVTWQLNEDGSLRGRPSCRNIARSVTDSNRPQAALHCERAIRAVQLAAPFDLPEQFYSRWQNLEWEFNRRL